jgi:hypothetical protein
LAVGRRSARTPGKLAANPPRDHRDDMRLFFVRECATRFDVVPLRQASAAAGGGRVLGDEHRMSTERRLPAVVARLGGREPLRDQLGRVVENRRQSLLVDVRTLASAEPEALAEGRAPQRGEEIIDVSHAADSSGSGAWRELQGYSSPPKGDLHLRCLRGRGRRRCGRWSGD